MIKVISISESSFPPLVLRRGTTFRRTRWWIEKIVCWKFGQCTLQKHCQNDLNESEPVIISQQKRVRGKTNAEVDWRFRIVRLVAACLHAFPLSVLVLPEIMNPCSNTHSVQSRRAKLHKSKTYSKHANISVIPSPHNGIALNHNTACFWREENRRKRPNSIIIAITLIHCWCLCCCVCLYQG